MKRFLSTILTLLMLISAICVAPVSVGAAKVDVAETSATITGGQTFYLKPNSNWTQANARFAIYLCNGSSAATWVSMTQVADASAVVYEATVPAGQSHANVIFCRMNPANTTNDWNNKWNQTNDLTWDGTKNCYEVKSGTWDKGGGTWSTYTAPQTAQPGDASGYYLMGTLTDWTTGQNMVYSEDTAVVTTTVEAQAGSYALKVKNGDNWMGAYDVTTTVEGGTIDVADVDGNIVLTLDGGKYTFNFSIATKTLAITYKAPEGGDVVDPTFSIPWARYTGLYAYAAVTEEVGTDAWQLWKSVSGKTYNYFFLPASASETEVIIYNNYASAVTVNGVEIASKDYATVPYTNGAEATVSGATSKPFKVMKSDAEGTLYINSKDGMTTKDDNGVKGTRGAEYDVYSFLTSGTKNQEASKLGGAVADDTGVTEGTTVKKIKGRGNSTWNLSKKPFNITYNDSIQIDGIAKGKKWSLLANAQDSSLLRNRLVYDLANETNMHYACDSRFVDFFVNGAYLGSYQLVQKIEMGKNTVMPDLTEPEVEDVIDEETGEVIAYPKENFDFILELDTARNAATAGDMTFTTTRGQVMTHKTPDAPAAEQVAFMKAKYQAVEDALYTGDLATLATLVDINDFARAYLINEVAKNLDSGVTSCYFVYDSDAGIFYMSPVWDYDNALGNSVSIAERHDAEGNMLDLTQPGGLYASELMHYDTNFKGGKSVFAQACSITSTVDGKTFMDIVKDVWNADFADAAEILAGEAEAENGRLQSTDDYLASLANSGAWNYSYAGWQLSNATNNTWISNHNNLKMYVCDEITKTYTYEMKTYDQTTLEGQASYAADWMASRIEWMDAQFNEYTFVEPFIEIPEAPAGYITIFFENNWAWPDAKIHCWGPKGDYTTWPGAAITNYYKTTDGGYDVYYIQIPADTTGIVFHGTGGYGDDLSTDITSIADGNCYYMTYDAVTNSKPCGIYTIDYKGGNEDPTEPVPTTPDPTVPEEPTTPSEEPTTAPTEPPVAEYITVYFTNCWMWTDVTCYFWGSAFEATPQWPGISMTKVDINEYSQDIYKATIPADATGMLFAGLDNGAETKSGDITDIRDGWGYYMDWTEEEGVHVDMYQYVTPAVPELVGSTVTLGGNLGVNFWFQIDDKKILNDENAKVIVTLPNGTQEEIPVSEGNYTNGWYVFNAEVAAKEMTATIEVQLVATDYATEVYSYTVKEYCESILAAPETYAKEQDIVKALLNYGAASQVYFGYNTVALANDTEYMTAEDKILTQADLSTYAPVIDSECDVVSFYGASLILDTETTLKLYFAMYESRLSGDVEDMYVSVNGTPGPKLEKNGNMYTLKIENIAAHDLSKVFKIEIGNNFTITHSALGYAYIAQQKDKPALVDVANALAAYNAAAVAYK